MRTVLAQRGNPVRAVGMGVVLAVAATLAGCGDGGSQAGGDAGGAQIVVTTSILGDVVEALVGDGARVEVVMPRNVDPHEFAPSAKQAAALREAAVIVTNGLGFEAGLDDAVDAARDDGATVLTATDYVETLPFGASAELEGDVSDAEHDDHDHAGDDPHVFTDPVRMADVARGLAADLAAAIPTLATPAERATADAYVADLEALHDEVTATLDAVPAGRRILVTNHEVFGYFARRYGFEVLGAVIPGGSTLAEPSAAALADLAEQIDDAGVPAIFVETSSSARLAEALAAEGTDVEVVALYSESLGEEGSEGATYVDMVRTNARRIAGALGGP